MADSEASIMKNVGTKLAYKPVSLALAAAAGAVSSVAFKQVWKHVAHDSDAPDATDEDRGWGEILVAAALQGAIFALVRAAISRAGATGVKRATGRWPG
jgi:hypothetical protein